MYCSGPLELSPEFNFDFWNIGTTNQIRKEQPMLKPYSVDIEVITKWTVEIHANDEVEAQEIAENMDLDEIESSADFKEVVSVQSTDVQEITDKETIDDGE